MPESRATLWSYVGAAPATPHTIGTVVRRGSVTLGSASADAGSWPLTVGAWTAHLLVDDSYTSIGSVDFDVK
jgi:hypothetical protein